MPLKLSRPKPSALLTTPGVNTAKLDQRPPLIGRLLIWVWSTTGAKSDEVVLICGASAETSTTSSEPAGFSLGLTSVMAPTFTVTSDALYGAKLPALTVIP